MWYCVFELKYDIIKPHGEWIGGKAMGTVRRIFTCLLVSVLLLTLFSSCGNSQSQDLENNNIDSIESVFQNKGFTITPDYEILANISEKYSKQIALNPPLYLTYNTPPVNNMIALWSDECKSFFNSQTRAGVAYLLTLDGSISEVRALEYYKNKSQMVYNNFKSHMDRYWLAGPTYYFVYTTHVKNPDNINESIWVTYEILYLEVQ